MNVLHVAASFDVARNHWGRYSSVQKQCNHAVLKITCDMHLHYAVYLIYFLNLLTWNNLNFRIFLSEHYNMAGQSLMAQTKIFTWQWSDWTKGLLPSLCWLTQPIANNICLYDGLGWLTKTGEGLCGPLWATQVSQEKVSWPPGKQKVPRFGVLKGK